MGSLRSNKTGTQNSLATPLVLERRGQFLLVAPTAKALAALRTTAVAWSREGTGGGRRLVRRTVPLYENARVDGREVAILPAGLEDLVVALLRSDGVRHEIRGELPPLPEPAIPAGRDPDTALVRAVRQNPRLLVRLDPGRVDAARLVGQIARAFPTRSVAVAALRNKTCRDLTAGLAELGLEPTSGGALPGATDPPPRLSVATFARLDLGAIRLQNLDVLVFADALDALGRVATAVLRRAGRARVVGLLDRTALVSDPDLDGLLARFGSTRLTITRHGTHVRPVRVVTRPFANRSPAPPGAPLPEVLKAGVWEHPERNRLLAGLAKRLAPACCLVLAGSPEQARLIGRLLPGWPVVIGVGAGLPPWSAPAGCVATGTAVRGLDLAGFDAVVRADAGMGLPPGVADDALAVRGERPALLLYDLLDRHHPALRRAAAARLAAYADAGWAVNSDDPAEADLARLAALNRGRSS